MSGRSHWERTPISSKKFLSPRLFSIGGRESCQNIRKEKLSSRVPKDRLLTSSTASDRNRYRTLGLAIEIEMTPVLRHQFRTIQARYSEGSNNMDRKLMAMPIGLGMLIIGHLPLPAHALPHRKAASATTAPKITITKVPMDPPSEEMASSEIEGTVTAPPANSHVVVYALGRRNILRSALRRPNGYKNLQGTLGFGNAWGGSVCRPARQRFLYP